MNPKIISIGDVTIPLGDFAVAGTAWLGIKKAGKTYGAKGVAEQLIGHGVPLIVFDAIGLWRFLKTPGDGQDSKGYKVVVAGGEEPDIPLTAQNASEIIRAAMRSNVSLVIDLYDPKLSKADWRKIVQAGFHTLLYENKQHGPRYIILEEAAEYVPQKVYDGETYAAVEKMVRMGGNVGLGVALINPRSQELNKAVLDLCDNLILMRQRGSAAIDAVQKWMDKVNPEIADEITTSLPKISGGECWVWAENSETPVFTKTHKLHSFHPDRTRHGENIKTRQSVDTAEFVSTLLSELPKVVEEKKANDPTELKRTIADLKRKVVELERNPVLATQPKPVEVHVLVDTELHHIKLALNTYKEAAESIRKVEPVIQKIETELSKFTELTGRNKNHWALPLKTSLAGARIARSQVAPDIRPARSVRPAGDVSNGSAIGKGERTVLIVAAQYPDGVSDAQIAVMTGYKSTSRNEFKKKLLRDGLVERRGDTIVATDAGIRFLGQDYQPLPTGSELRAYWNTRLTGGEAAIFKIAVEKYPEQLHKTELQELTSYKGTSVNEFCKHLAARKLITTDRGMVRAAENLFLKL